MIREPGVHAYESHGHTRSVTDACAPDGSFQEIETSSVACLSRPSCTRPCSSPTHHRFLNSTLLINGSALLRATVTLPMVSPLGCTDRNSPSCESPKEVTSPSMRAQRPFAALNSKAGSRDSFQDVTIEWRLCAPSSRAGNLPASLTVGGALPLLSWTFVGISLSAGPGAAARGDCRPLGTLA